MGNQITQEFFYNKYNMTEKISSPNHYQGLNDLRVIDVIDRFNLNFSRGCAVKYVLRAGHKLEEGYTKEEKEIEDLEKAIWYITHEVNLIKERSSIADTEIFTIPTSQSK